MAQNKTTKTQANKTTKKAQTPKSFDFRKPLLFAYNNANKHALSKKEVEQAGCSGGHFDAWVALSKDVHTSFSNYFKATVEGGTTEKDLAALRGKCFAAVRKAYEVTTITPREADLDFLLGDIKKKLDMGVSVYGTQGEAAFRRMLETYIGVRMAEQIVLDAQDTDTVKQYLAAISRINKANTAITALYAIVQNTQILRDKAKAKTTQAVYQTMIDDAKTAIDDQKAKLDKARTQAQELRNAYVTAMEKVKNAKDVQIPEAQEVQEAEVA